MWISWLFQDADHDCGIHKFFISFNLILCVIISVVAILPKVQEAQPRSGLLQAAVITLYVQYLTWSAMTNNPGKLRHILAWAASCEKVPNIVSCCHTKVHVHLSFAMTPTF